MNILFMIDAFLSFPIFAISGFLVIENDNPDLIDKKWFYSTRILILILLGIITAMIDNINSFTNILGSVALSISGIILPPYLFIKVKGSENMSYVKLIWHYFLILLGFFITLNAIITMIIDKYQNNI
jgi:hypothetical protein